VSFLLPIALTRFSSPHNPLGVAPPMHATPGTTPSPVTALCDHNPHGASPPSNQSLPSHRALPLYLAHARLPAGSFSSARRLPLVRARCPLQLLHVGSSTPWMPLICTRRRYASPSPRLRHLENLKGASPHNQEEGEDEAHEWNTLWVIQSGFDGPPTSQIHGR
jgi:hypothetical protein